MTVLLPPASPQFLREDEVRRGIELIYFGYMEMISSADARLSETPYGRAHHRALYFIARRPGLSVGALLGLLRITKQSLSRVVNDLKAGGLIAIDRGRQDRRQRLLRLTEAGEEFERDLFERLRERMTNAYSEAGQEAVTGFWNVLAALLPEEDRRRALNL
ncbi:MarR family transcriptional regulator [Pacificimonas flava]|uniref:MarR family transcriptional regulator n=2 Tax=Pacificimonas TaxID=1960290 RepID=A0A219B7F3_9SPHN|nr:MULTISPECIES: MarR family transcriptional regulator [Pacificimonas]MBZ6378696.1 MarR family transcriptional regulator [Pacificimonas aurantium]OWV34036.1 MarR family transcriptional regulator [Pacificimonas flava]